MIDDCDGGFCRQTLPPEFPGQQVGNFDFNLVVDCPWNEATTANKSMCLAVDGCPKPQPGMFWPAPTHVPIQFFPCLLPAQNTIREVPTDVAVSIKSAKFVEIIGPEFSQRQSWGLQDDQYFTRPNQAAAGTAFGPAFAMGLNMEAMRNAPMPMPHAPTYSQP